MKKTSLKNHILKLSVVTAIAGFTATGVYAEGIEEIVVTATKRAESIQDVSASITAVDTATMARAGIEDVTRLEHIVPGLRVGQSGGEGRLAMRGTRTNNVGPEAEQVVGIFQDGVYVPTTTQATGAYVDLERIEVLRGPQGTLYGRNTFGGTINIHSKQPTFDEVEGYAKMTLGDYNKRKIEAAINVPVSDTFAVRLATMSDDHDGYVENTFDPSTRDDLDENNAKYFRITAKYQPTDNFSATLRHSDYEKEANTTAIWGYQQIGFYANDDGVYNLGHGFLPADAVQPVDNGPWSVSRNFPSSSDIEDTSTSLALQYDANAVTAKLLYNETDFDGFFLSDFDYSNGGAILGATGDFAFLGRNNTQETNSIEAQLVSNTDSAFEWMLGYYNYEQKADWGWVSSFDGVLANYGYGTTEFRTESSAIFANAGYSISDRLRVSAGIRSNEDTKGSGAAENSWKDTLWKTGIEYDVGDNRMAYFSVSTGFRAGGANGGDVVADILATENRDISLYDPEKVTAYEVGLKSTLRDGELVLNLAAFLNNYTDMHAQSFHTVTGQTVTSEYTENGGEVDAMGVEAEIKWAPTDEWYIVGSAAYLDAEFGNYNIRRLNGLGTVGGRNGVDSLSLEGWSPALSPKLTMGGQISRDYNLGSRGTLTPMLQFTYTSDYYSSDINLAPTQQDAHTKSDLRLIWDLAESDLQLEAFILNLEDEAVLNRTVPFNPGADNSITSIQANYSRPRTWGVSARYTF